MSPASSINSQINTGLGMGSTNTPLLYTQPSNPQTSPSQPQSQQQYYMQNTYNPDFMSTLPGMDFLNSMSNNTTADGDSGDMNFNFENGALGDLGFGMGLDYQHDWSDGQQYDLFDGFFFGNGNGGGGGGYNA